MYGGLNGALFCFFLAIHMKNHLSWKILLNRILNNDKVRVNTFDVIHKTVEYKISDMAWFERYRMYLKTNFEINDLKFGFKERKLSDPNHILVYTE
jgi:hypothetical protein